MKALRCRSCGHAWELGDAEISFRCPKCASADTEIDASVGGAIKDTASSCVAYLIIGAILLGVTGALFVVRFLPHLVRVH